MARSPFVSFPVRPSRPGGKLSGSDIVNSLLGEVSAGHFPAGSRLPPVRQLEQQLGLSKNTVQAAYDELVARGVLETREREGVFIAARPEHERPARREVAPPMPRLREPPGLPAAGLPPEGIRLSTVFIDPELLPRERLADCARSVLRNPGQSSFYEAQGYLPLREQIAARLQARGFDCGADEVIITTGSQQAIDLLARSMAERRGAVESPVYAHARSLFTSLGIDLLGLRLDPFEGAPLDAWEQAIAASRPAFFYTVTSFQNPTGYSYSTHELTSILEIAARHGVALIEDDWGSDMLSGSEYRPMLRALGGKPVVYINSFTKKLLPSLRVGFLLADRSLIPALVAYKRLSTLGNAWLTEAIVAEFLDRGYYDAHLASVQRELDARYTRCLASLAELMPEGVRWTTPGGGPTLWLDLPRSIDLAALRARAAARGVLIEDASSAFLGPAHLHGFRVSYAFLPPEKLRQGLDVVAGELRAMLA